MPKCASAQLWTVPAFWRGKAYRRLEPTADPQAREKAEIEEHRVYGSKIVDLLVEARLPFGQEVSPRGLKHDSAEGLGCLRGLRGSAGASCRRCLTAHFGVPFPQEARHELSYFQFRKAEQAARTVYQSLLLVLDFTEVSGEVPYVGRLAQLPALPNATKEDEAQRATLVASLGVDTSKKQAPPLLLALQAALERTVADSQLPLFHLCSWSSNRDTQSK